MPLKIENDGRGLFPGNIPQDLYALEYSKTQHIFHIALLSSTLLMNLNSIAKPKNQTNDYKIIFIGTEKECEDLKEELKPVAELARTNLDAFLKKK